jgi:hypothetical protein
MIRQSLGDFREIEFEDDRVHETRWLNCGNKCRQPYLVKGASRPVLSITSGFSRSSIDAPKGAAASWNRSEAEIDSM